jgi:hypothetical protein
MGYGFTRTNSGRRRRGEHLRRAGARGDARAGQRGRPEPHQGQKTGPDNRVCGCMVQQEHMAEKLKKSYPIVDLVFGPHELWRFPELLLEVMRGITGCSPPTNATARWPRACPKAGTGREGLAFHHVRLQQFLHLLRGALRPGPGALPPAGGHSRPRPGSLVAAGYKDITLLGQNVNSYGKDLWAGDGVDFSRPHPHDKRHPGGLPHPLHDQPPQGRHGKAVQNHGRVRKMRPPHTSARCSPAPTGC